MRRGLSTEVYIEITAQNAQAGVNGIRLGLQGTVAPGGDTGDQDAAGIGSLFHRTDTGAIYRKKANGGSTADWEELGTANLSNLKWRQEKVRFATNDTIVAGTFDITSLSDNDDMTIPDVAVGEFCLGDIDGTPALFEVTDKPSANNITVVAATIPLADNNTFVVQQYLPDVSGQENSAIIHFPTSTSAAVKLSDFDWKLADAITLNGYADTVGAVTGTETVQVAIQKVEKGLKDLLTAVGVGRNDLNLGSFNSPATLYLTTTETVKSAIQKLADLHAQLRGVEVIGITTMVDVDSVPVASVTCVKWLVEYFETGTPANRGAFEIFAINAGDVTAPDFVNPYAKLKLGSNIAGKAVDIDVSGGNMRLRMGFTPSCTVRARRIEVIKNVS